MEKKEKKINASLIQGGSAALLSRRIVLDFAILKS
jgi:hypothetical protein